MERNESTFWLKNNWNSKKNRNNCPLLLKQKESSLLKLFSLLQVLFKRENNFERSSHFVHLSFFLINPKRSSFQYSRKNPFQWQWKTVEISFFFFFFVTSKKKRNEKETWKSNLKSFSCFVVFCFFCVKLNEIKKNWKRYFFVEWKRVGRDSRQLSYFLKEICSARMKCEVFWYHLYTKSSLLPWLIL